MPTDFRVEELEYQVLTLTRRVSEAEASAVRAEEKLARMTVEVGIRDAVARAKTPINPASLEDVLRRASAIEWREVDGKGLVALDGHLPAIDATGRDMTAAVWLEGLTVMLPHLFQAGDTADTGTAAGKNPWKKGSPDFSLTEQGRIYATDPALAVKLAAEAGVRLEA